MAIIIYFDKAKERREKHHKKSPPYPQRHTIGSAERKALEIEAENYLQEHLHYERLLEEMVLSPEFIAFAYGDSQK